MKLYSLNLENNINQHEKLGVKQKRLTRLKSKHMANAADNFDSSDDDGPPKAYRLSVRKYSTKYLLALTLNVNI